MTRKQAQLLLGFWLVVVPVLVAPPVMAQATFSQAAAPAPAASPVSTGSISASSTSDGLRDSSLSDPGARAAIAQATQQSMQPIDLAPVKLPERRTATETLNSFQTGILYKLPSRMFFQSSTENSLRLETNVFQTLYHNHADMIYRPMTNNTLGYALTRRTRVSANYFFIRDQYTRNDTPLSRNFQSVGMRIDQDIPITKKTTATIGFMDRTLFVSHTRWLHDMLPSISVSRPVGYRGFVYASAIGQLRWFNVFQTMQEGDIFYSLGGVYRRGPWILSCDNTFITNFRKRRLAGPNNENFILTFEAARRIIPKIPLPLYAFVRAQPIFNVGSNQALGFAGFNFRIFGGLRIDINKPAIFPVKLARL